MKRLLAIAFAFLICGVLTNQALAQDSQAQAQPEDVLAIDNLRQLQQRLADSGCYKGAMDGRKSPELDAAIKACPDQSPHLVIDVGAHRSRVLGMNIDQQCKLLASASDDGTMRLWSLPDGKLLQTYRFPDGPGHGGFLPGGALSPSGAYLAIGAATRSWTRDLDTSLTLVHLKDQNRRTIGGFKSSILAATFSLDEKTLALGLGDGTLALVDVATGQAQQQITLSSGAGVLVLRSGKSHFYAATADGVYAIDQANPKAAPVLLAPGSFRALAVNEIQHVAVAVPKDGASLMFIDLAGKKQPVTATFPKAGDQFYSRVDWSQDGATLFAAGTRMEDSASKGVRMRSIYTYDATGRETGHIAASDDSFGALRSCGDQVYFDTGEGGISRTNAAGQIQALVPRHTLILRGAKNENFLVSDDGTKINVQWNFDGSQRLAADLLQGSVEKIPVGDTAGLHASDKGGMAVENPRISDRDFAGGTRTQIAGKEINGQTLDMAIGPAHEFAYLGARGLLTKVGADGKVAWRNPVGFDVWGVNVAQGGRLVVATERDGAFHWYRATDGVELLRLFVDAPTLRWVAYTHSGYYAASPGGEDLFGWKLNRGWSDAPDFFPASRFRAKFSRPDVIRAIFQTLDEAEALKQANQALPRLASAVDSATVAGNLPPVVSDLTAGNDGTFSAQQVTLKFNLRSSSGKAIDRIQVLADGRPVQPVQAVVPPGGGVGTATVQLPARDVDVAVLAYSGDAASDAAQLHLKYEEAGLFPAEDAGADALKPSLYILAVGVSDYVDTSLTLKLPGKDAKDFAATFMTQQGALYGKVITKVLADRDATHDSVLEGLDWLEHQTTSRDLAIVFIAGHGVVDDNGRYWYLPSDATPEKLRIRGISRDEISGTLSRLAGKAILFLDTCHAGGVAQDGAKTRGILDINSTLNDFSASENGVVVFGSSTGREVSFEKDEWGNGAFTKALIEGIGQGKADLLHNGEITLSGLDAYVAERVKELTDGKQHPVMAKPTTVNNYPIAVAQK